MSGRLCQLQNPCWERWEARGRGQGEFWGARFAAARPTRQGDPEGAEAPQDPGKIPFPGEPLGSVAAGRSRGSAGGERLRNSFLFTPLLARLNADSAPEMSLLPCPCHPIPPPSSPPRGEHPGPASLQLEKAAPLPPQWHLILGAD